MVSNQIIALQGKIDEKTRLLNEMNDALKKTWAAITVESEPIMILIGILQIHDGGMQVGDACANWLNMRDKFLKDNSVKSMMDLVNLESFYQQRFKSFIMDLEQNGGGNELPLLMQARVVIAGSKLVAH